MKISRAQGLLAAQFHHSIHSVFSVLLKNDNIISTGDGESNDKHFTKTSQKLPCKES